MILYQIPAMVHQVDYQRKEGGALPNTPTVLISQLLVSRGKGIR